MNLTLEQINARLAGRNPFASFRVRPGRLSYRFFDDTPVSRLVDQLKSNAWMGEIVGPAGSGKTTLVHTLVPSLKQAGRHVKIIDVRPGESRLPIAGNELQTWDKSTQIVVDGYDQLGGWTRTLLSRICRTRGCGLLRISCEPTGDALLYQTDCSLQLVQKLVREIQANVECHVFEADVSTSYARYGANVRDHFIHLHEIYEGRCK